MDNNDIDRGFDRIVAENSTYYLLAYYPSQPRDLEAPDLAKTEFAMSGIVVFAEVCDEGSRGASPGAYVLSLGARSSLDRTSSCSGIYRSR
jgi:hypothetical protein